jgi:hypothetical protein
MPDLRRVERDSIRRFVKKCANLGYFEGNVLDYGCGQQPYREIIEAAGGTYYGWDKASLPGSVVKEDVGELPPFELLGEDEEFDCVLMTQVWQYMPLRVLKEVLYDLGYGQGTLKISGYLVVTGVTNWPEVEVEDLYRFTQAGARRLLEDSGFEVLEMAPRAYHPAARQLSLGWGAVAQS